MVSSLLTPAYSQTIVSRRYWITPLDSVALGRSKHTHIEVTGDVQYVAWQDDGDLHIRLGSPSLSGLTIVVECIPKLPCSRPKIGSRITVQGISRADPEHHWWEIHPVEAWR